MICTVSTVSLRRAKPTLRWLLALCLAALLLTGIVATAHIATAHHLVRAAHPSVSRHGPPDPAPARRAAASLSLPAPLSLVGSADRGGTRSLSRRSITLL